MLTTFSHSYTEKIRSGKPKMNHKGFPSFVYNETAGADSVAQGLFLGDILKKVYLGFSDRSLITDILLRPSARSGQARTRRIKSRAWEVPDARQSLR